MSTKMNDEDWAHTLAVFRACLPRRGRKGADDRSFLEALHFFAVETCAGARSPNGSAIGTACGNASTA